MSVFEEYKLIRQGRIVDNGRDTKEEAIKWFRKHLEDHAAESLGARVEEHTRYRIEEDGRRCEVCWNLAYRVAAFTIREMERAGDVAGATRINVWATAVGELKE